MRVIFFGTPEFAVPPLRQLTERHDVALVVTRPDRAVGRRGQVVSPSVATVARELNLDLFQPPNPNHKSALETIASYGAELFVVVAYGRLLGARLMEVAPRGGVNAHPSLLPTYRGASPIQAAIAAGDRETGVSLIRIVEAVDAGPIIANETTSIGTHEKASDVRVRLAEITSDLLARELPRWFRGEVGERVQDERLASLTRQLQRVDAEFDLRRPASELYDRWRAFHPWPGAQVRVGRVTCKLLELTLDAENQGMGSVFLRDDVLVIGCGSGSLGVSSIQPAGRTPMRASDFARGYTPLLDLQWGHPFPDSRPPITERLND